MTYLDTSAIVSLVLVDAHTADLLRWLDRTRPSLVLSTFGCLEFGAVIGRSVRMGGLSAAEGDRTLAIFDDWAATEARTAEVEPEDHRLAATFVRRYATGLRAPDAVHLATCRRLRTPMLTFDALQAEAARQFGLSLETCS